MMHRLVHASSPSHVHELTSTPRKIKRRGAILHARIANVGRRNAPSIGFLRNVQIPHELRKGQGLPPRKKPQILIPPLLLSPTETMSVSYRVPCPGTIPIWVIPAWQWIRQVLPPHLLPKALLACLMGYRGAFIHVTARFNCHFLQGSKTSQTWMVWFNHPTCRLGSFKPHSIAPNNPSRKKPSLGNSNLWTNKNIHRSQNTTSRCQRGFVSLRRTPPAHTPVQR